LNPEAEMSSISGDQNLREQLAVLRDEASKNSEILKVSQDRELRLLQAPSLTALFVEMTVGLKDSHKLDAVSLILLDPEHETRHLAAAEGFKPDSQPDILFMDSLIHVAPQFSTLYKSWLGPYIGADHQLLFSGREDLESLAIMPLRRQDQLIGSLVFGSKDERRFTRHHGTDFLNHLSNVAAVCLENATNRARLVRSGLTDVLTGMHNRRYLQSRLTEELASAQRSAKSLACLLIDIDFFKTVNDTYGHLAGDHVLREIAQRVESEVRGSDVSARYGGEEFALLLPATRALEAVVLAERILVAVSAQPVCLEDGKEVPMTVSIGIAETRPQQGMEDLKSLGERLLAEADVQLYKAKTEGRNRVCLNE
jgi:two-component system cell cycle response regulator